MFKARGTFDALRGMFAKGAGVPFSPSQIFAALQGAWYEPSTDTTYQESTGITPGALGSTVGLLLDRSQGLVVGPELVTNGTFDTDTVWVKQTGWSISGGQAIRSSATSNSGIVQSITVTTGKTYRVIVDVISISGVGSIYSPSTTQTILSFSSVGSFSAYFTAPNSGSYQIGIYGTGTASITADNISVRQIAGNHATQSTAANRPLLTTDSNNKVLLRHDATDVLTASLPALSGGNYSTAASVYFATNVGMSALHGNTIGTTYNLPALNTDVYGWVITPERLSAVQESRLERYMLRLAGLPEPDYFVQEDYGPELITGFTLGAGWTYTGGILASDGAQGGVSAAAESSASAEIGKTYVVSYTRNQSAGLVQVRCSDTFLTTHSAGSGTSTFIAKATSIGKVLRFSSTNPSAVCQITNISVRELKDGMTGYLLDDNDEPLLRG